VSSSNTAGSGTRAELGEELGAALGDTQFGARQRAGFGTRRHTRFS
jgi:hypothetical protein